MSMIPLSDSTWESQSWQTLLSNTITDVNQLAELLQLDITQLKALLPSETESFHLKVPMPYLKRIKLGDIHDPLLKQILPLAVEYQDSPGFTLDPLNENAANKLPGIIHKYANRILLTLTGTCAIHCRYCFRRHFPYDSNQISNQKWETIVNYLKNQPQVNEIILSGGDPLILNDKYLTKLLQNIALLPQIKRLRIHSRLPVVIPQRITDRFVQLLAESSFKSILVLHINHPNEIDAQLRQRLAKLHDQKILVLNQTVLLKNVNDHPETLANLSEALFVNHVMPYYLHLLDKVKGAAHFAIDEDTARKLYGELLSLLPGYLVPKLVSEAPNLTSKYPISAKFD